MTATPAASRVFRGARTKDPGEIVGYVTPEAVNLYDEPGARWYSASHADFAIGRRHHENNIVVGFVVSLGPGGETPAGSETFAAAATAARFKIRPPIQKLHAEATGRRGATRSGDLRGLARGAVCETRPREELDAYARRLRDAVARTSAKPQATRGGSAAALAAQLGYAARFDRAARKRFPSASEMCDTLRLHLLALEEDARAPVDGMTSGLRWLYLFNDRMPTVSALMGKTGGVVA